MYAHKIAELFMKLGAGGDLKENCNDYEAIEKGMNDLSFYSSEHSSKKGGRG